MVCCIVHWGLEALYAIMELEVDCICCMTTHILQDILHVPVLKTCSVRETNTGSLVNFELGE